MPLETNNINYTFSKRLFFTIDKTDIFEFNMEIIRYKEEKGLLGLFENWIDKKKEYRCIDIKSIEKSESNIILDKETGEIEWVSDMTMTQEEQEEIYDRLDVHGFYRLPTSFDIRDYDIMENFVNTLFNKSYE